MNSWTGFLVFFIALDAMAQGKPVSAHSISYDDLPKMVKERNEKVQSAEFTLKASEERTGSWTRSFAPKFTIEGGREQYSSDGLPRAGAPFWKFNTSINLYRGGKDALESDARQANVRAARASFGQEMNVELKEARQTYWKIVATQILLADRKSNQEKNEKNLRSARRRVGAGVATSADAVQFELQGTIVSQEIKKLELELDTNRSKLSTALGLDEHENLVIKSEFPKPQPLEAIPAVPSEDQLEVKVLNERRIFERLKQEQAERWWRPTVDLYSSYGIRPLSEDYDHASFGWKELTMGVRVSVDLGEGGSALRESRARSFEASALERQAAHRIREVKAADHEIRHDLKILAVLLLDADRDVEKAERFLKLTESEYTRGAKNGPDLLGAFQTYHEFKDRRTELYREYFDAQAELLALTAKEEKP